MYGSEAKFEHSLYQNLGVVGVSSAFANAMAEPFVRVSAGPCYEVATGSLFRRLVSGLDVSHAMHRGDLSLDRVERYNGRYALAFRAGAQRVLPYLNFPMRYAFFLTGVFATSWAINRLVASTILSKKEQKFHALDDYARAIFITMGSVIGVMAGSIPYICKPAALPGIGFVSSVLLAAGTDYACKKAFYS